MKLLSVQFYPASCYFLPLKVQQEFPEVVNLKVRNKHEYDSNRLQPRPRTYSN
jgi:hypothetical protein